MSFRGTFDYTLDAKNRLTVPAKMRSQLTETVVLSRATEKCVAVWPKGDFDTFVEGVLAGTGPLDPKRDAIKRYFYAHSYDVELDSAGRVMVPPKLLEYGGLAKEVVVNGMGDRIEVWDRERWSEYDDAQDITALTSLFADAPA